VKIAHVLVLTLLVGGGGALWAVRSCAPPPDDAHSPRAADAAGFAQMSAVFLRSGDVDAAVAAGRTAIELDRRNVEAHLNLGDALARKSEWNEALANYREALRLRPECVEAHFGIGQASNALDDTQGAEHAFRECIRLRPDYAEAHMNLASNLAVQERFAEAIEEMKRANELGSQRADWKYPTKDWIAEFERELLEHGDAPKSPVER
jgi:tetratricopeptide (TPR) repeat protein